MATDIRESHPLRILVEGLSFPESPRWRDGWLWFSDLVSGQVRAVDGAGQEMAVIDSPDEPGGLGWLPDGHLLVVGVTERKLLRYNGRRLTEFADLSSLTDYYLKTLLVDSAGRAYVSCSGYDDQKATAPQPSQLILVEMNGTARRVGSDLLLANGMAITPDRQTLIVAETASQRLSAFDIAADGSLDRHRVWGRLAGLTPGGLCLDREGAVWVASPLSSEVLRIREGGEILDRISIPGNPTSCVLGGDEGKTLFVTVAALLPPRPGSGRIEAIPVAIGATDKGAPFGSARCTR
jgi:sugar lactone lactonase YvrE